MASYTAYKQRGAITFKWGDFCCWWDLSLTIDIIILYKAGMRGGLQLCVCLYVNSGAPPHHHRFPFCFSFFFFFSVMSTILTQYPATAWELKAMEWVWKRENISYIRCSRFLSLWMQTQPHAKVIWKPMSDTRVLNTLLCVLGLYIC